MQKRTKARELSKQRSETNTNKQTNTHTHTHIYTLTHTNNNQYFNNAASIVPRLHQHAAHTPILRHTHTQLPTSLIQPVQQRNHGRPDQNARGGWRRVPDTNTAVRPARDHADHTAHTTNASASQSNRTHAGDEKNNRKIEQQRRLKSEYMLSSASEGTESACRSEQKTEN